MKKVILIVLSILTCFYMAIGLTACGKDGQSNTPTIEIGSDGYWYINGTKTDYKANGEQGDKGEKGDKGDKGDSGEQGEKGEKGDKGDAGEKGSDGINGSNGVDGKDGINGSDGKDGKDGKDGVDGKTPEIKIGENGNWFIDGVDTNVKAQGEKGDKGDSGEKGEQGEKGSDGINGSDGKDGVNGKSAYEIYKEKYGYEGTEEQWLDDLVNGRLALKDKYTVTFDSDGGSEVKSQEVSDGKKATEPDAPTKTGYTFGGWFVKTTEWNFLAYTVTENVTLKAKWEARTYTVSFNYNNGNGNNGSIIATYDSEMPSINGVPTRTGYIFAGYYDSANNGTKYYNADLTSAKTWDKTSNTTLYAHWVGVDYSVRFDGNGSTSGRMDNQAFVYATAQNLNANRFARTGYTFASWNTEADGSGTSHDNSASVNNLTTENNGTVVLYAQWKINQYTATFKNFDGEILYSVKLNYNEIPVYAGETPVKERTAEFSYFFSGWDKEIVAISENVVYTAQFISETNKYQIVWENYDGSIIKTDTLLYGTEPNYDGDIPVKPSTQQYTYVFAGWTPAIEKVIKNIEYTAVYTQTINKYTVTFKNYDGSILSCSTVEYGANAAYNATTPQRPDENHKSYEFKGWSDSLNNITANKDVIAVYIVYDVYNFTYIDGTSKTITVLEGTTIDDLIPTNTSTIVSGNLETSYEWKKRNNYEYFEVEKTRNVYNITYLLNGGTNDTRNPSVVYGDENYRLYAANKIGYEFVSWCTDEDLTAEILSLNNIANNTTLYAKYKPIVYSITYYLFNGENALKNPDSYTIEDEINLKEASKIGYTFDGWFLDETFNLPIEIISKKTGDICLYALFTSNEYSSTFLDGVTVTLKVFGYNDIKYYLNYGDNFDPYSYDIMSNYLTDDYNKYYGEESYFEGWFNNDKLIDSSLSISEDIVLDGVFDDTVTSSYLNMFSNDGTTKHDITNPDLTNYGTKEYRFRVPTLCDGIISIEYYLNLSGRDGYYGGDMSIQDVTNIKSLYSKHVYSKDKNSSLSGSATIIAIPGSVICVHTESYSGGYIKFTSQRRKSIILSHRSMEESVRYDESIKLPNVAFRDGYKFIGWFDENNNLISQSWNYTENKTFTPKWKAIPYNITYELYGGNNNDNNPQSYTFGSNYILGSPTKQGYTFDGWYLDGLYSSKIEKIFQMTGDIILHAKFTPISFDLTLDSFGGEFAPKILFISDGTIIKTENLYENESIENFYPNSKKGYLFAGWYTDEEYQNVFNFDGTITEDLILYAKWIKDEENVLLINETISNISMSINGKTEKYIKFVPVSNTSITVTSISELDLIGTLYDANKNVLISADDINESNLNFSFTFNIEAGKLYYIGIKGVTVGAQGDFNVSITWNGNSCIKGTTYTNRTISIVYDATFILPDNVEKEGYKFVGWFDDNNNKYESGIWNYLNDLTLHAVYEEYNKA